jgi:hypothetical protein
VYGRIHNAPTLPSLVRAFVGVGMGYLPHMTEPLWGVGAEVLFNDEFYKRRRLRTQEKAKHGEWCCEAGRAGREAGLWRECRGCGCGRDNPQMPCPCLLHGFVMA